MRPMLLSWCLVLVATPALAEPSIRDQAKTASGVAHLAEYPHGLELSGRAQQYGVETDYRLWIHPDGRFREFVGGEQPGLTVFDGSTLWERDRTRTVRTLKLEEADETWMSVLLTTGRWSTHDGVSTQPKDDGLWLQLGDGKFQGQLRVDASGHLKSFWRKMHEPQETTFIGTISHGLLTFPRRQETRQADAPVDWIEISQVRELSVADFGTPVQRPTTYDDVHFDVSVAPRLEVHAAPTGHLMVPVSINGHEPGWFIFDTGAGGQCVSTGAPWIEELETVGEIRVGGVGGSANENIVRGKRLQVGPVTMDDPAFLELDLTFLNMAMGVRVDGILGYDLLSRVVAEIDMVEATIALHDPSVYEADHDWEELILHDRHPNVRARFEGRGGLYKLDTGAAHMTVVFHAPYARRNALLVGRETSAGATGGVGGEVPIKVGTVSSFELAGHRSEHVQVSFALEDKGAFGDEYTAGNIGGILLEPFRLVFDYRHERIAFVPREGL